MTADLNRRIENIVRLGTIAEVDFAHAKAKVKSGGILTDWLPWVTARAGNVRTWSAPSVGEQCVILASSGELTTAVILVGIFTQNAPSHAPDENVIDFPDSARVVYIQDRNALRVVQEEIEVEEVNELEQGWFEQSWEKGLTLMKKVKGL